MAKRDSFLKFVVKANYEEKSVCAYEDGDEAFHYIKYEKDDDEAHVFRAFKNAYVEVYKCFPNEEGIRKEFEKVKEANKASYYSLKSFQRVCSSTRCKTRKIKNRVFGREEARRTRLKQGRVRISCEQGKPHLWR